jgi:hypothetical protein
MKKKSGNQDNALERIAVALERIADYYEAEEKLPESFSEDNEDERQYEAKIPSEIKLARPEELATGIIRFARTEFPDSEFNMWQIFDLFLKQKGLDNRFNLPADISLKLEKAKMLADKQLREERETSERQQLEKEKAGLQTLVNRCIDWAKSHGLKKLSQSDVDAFILENNLSILQQTKRSLWSMTNVAMKSKS